jgi:hypothetical protein
VSRTIRPWSVLLDAGCGRTVPGLRKLIGCASRLIGVDLVEFTDVPTGFDKLVTRFEALRFLRGWILVTLRRPADQ